MYIKSLRFFITRYIMHLINANTIFFRIMIDWAVICIAYIQIYHPWQAIINTFQCTCVHPLFKWCSCCSIPGFLCGVLSTIACLYVHFRFVPLLDWDVICIACIQIYHPWQAIINTCISYLLLSSIMS
jgi:hypothetical protein